MPTTQQVMEIAEMAIENQRFQDRHKELFTKYDMALVYIAAKEFKYRWIALFEIEDNNYWSAQVDVEFSDMPKTEVFKQRIYEAFERWLKANPKENLLKGIKVE